MDDDPMDAYAKQIKAHFAPGEAALKRERAVAKAIRAHFANAEDDRALNERVKEHLEKLGDAER